MFDTIASLLLSSLPAALFGRRRGGDRHGEIPGGRPGAEGFTGADIDPFAAFADLAGDPVGAPSAAPLEGSNDVAGEPVPGAGVTGSEPASPSPSEIAALDLTDLNLAELRRANQDLEGLFPPAGPDGTRDGGFDAPPGWVVGETSLDGPHVPHDQEGLDAEAERIAELWHEVPAPSPFVDAPPFEDLVPDLDATGGVWTPATIEPLVGPRLDDPSPPPFSLNRLKRVSGPIEHPGFGPTDDPFATVAPDQPAPQRSDESVDGPVAGSGHLTRSRVGRSGSTGAHGRARRGRRPLAGDRVTRPVPAPSAQPVPVVEARPAPAVEPRPLVVPVLVAADGVVATGTGSVRVARPEAASASSGPDGLLVHLLDHWCWAALDELGPDLVIRAGTTQLAVPAGSTALFSIDEDGAQLVVVLEGEGEVTHRGGRIQLRSGAIAYLPADGDPQVDVAPDDEIRADPLVARNLRLDAG